MDIYENRKSPRVNHPWLFSLVVLVLIVFGAMLFTQGIALALVPFLFGIPFEEMMDILSGTSTNPQARIAFFFIQTLGGGGAFLLGGWLFIRFVDKATMNLPLQWARVSATPLLLIIPMLAGFMGVNSLFIYLNGNVAFPEFLSGLEQSIRAKEEQLMKLTLFFTDFANFREFLMGLFVIGIMAGVGEEYLFRGILQPKLQQYTGNVHVAIWLSAVIFSAIHMQFLGFLPRMMLGALFGYMYAYSGSLIYPIIAHALNNAFTVVMVYLAKMGHFEFSLEGEPEMNWTYFMIGIPVFVFSARLFIQRQQLNRRKDGEMA